MRASRKKCREMVLPGIAYQIRMQWVSPRGPMTLRGNASLDYLQLTTRRTDEQKDAK